MNLVLQPEGSNLCGQACVAMVMGISLEDACRLLPSTTGTRPVRIREALSPLGWVLGPRRAVLEPGRVHLGRVQWERHRHHGHLFLVDVDGSVLDPYFGENPKWRDSAWVTSYYGVTNNR